MCIQGLSALWLHTSVSAGFGNCSCSDKITTVLLMGLPPLSPSLCSQADVPDGILAWPRDAVALLALLYVIPPLELLGGFCLLQDPPARAAGFGGVEGVWAARRIF